MGFCYRLDKKGPFYEVTKYFFVKFAQTSRLLSLLHLMQYDTVCIYPNQRDKETYPLPNRSSRSTNNICFEEHDQDKEDKKRNNQQKRKYRKYAWNSQYPFFYAYNCLADSKSKEVQWDTSKMNRFTYTEGHSSHHNCPKG